MVKSQLLGQKGPLLYNRVSDTNGQLVGQVCLVTSAHPYSNLVTVDAWKENRALCRGHCIIQNIVGLLRHL